MDIKNKLFIIFFVLVLCIILNISIVYLGANKIVSLSVIKILRGISAVVFSIIFVSPSVAYIKTRGRNENSLKKIFIALFLIFTFFIYYSVNYYFIFIR